MNHHHRTTILLRQENELLREQNITLTQTIRSPALCASCNEAIISADVVAEVNQLELENTLLVSQLETLNCFMSTTAMYRSLIPQAASSSIWFYAATAMSAIAIKEVVSLAKPRAPMWTNGTMLNLNEYYSKCFPWYAKNAPGFVHEVSRASSLVFCDAYSLVNDLMNHELWTKIFPSIIATMSMESQHQGFQVINMEFMPLISPSIQTRNAKLLRCCEYMENNTWVIANISMYFTSYEGNSHPKFMRFPSGYVVKRITNQVSRVTILDHWVYEQGGVINTNPNSGFGAHRWLDAIQRHCFNHCVNILPSIGHRIRTLGEVRKTNLLNMSGRMVHQFCIGVCGITGLNWNRLGMFGLPDNNLKIFTRESLDLSGAPCTFISAIGKASMEAKPEDVFRVIKHAEIKDMWNYLDPFGDMNEVFRIWRGRKSRNKISVFNFEDMISKEWYLIQETYYEATSAMIIHACIDADSFVAALNNGHVPGAQLLPFGFVIMPYGQHECVVSVGCQAMACRLGVTASDDLVGFMEEMMVNDTIRNVNNAVVVSSNLP